jgi:hypothetical protein
MIKWHGIKIKWHGIKIKINLYTRVHSTSASWYGQMPVVRSGEGGK